jgi:hypothetical protein
MSFWTPWTYGIAAAVLTICGCQPEIGDPCRLPSDCSFSGDRLCDTNLRGGYCTQFNCEPGTCPEESVCVAFGSSPSSHPQCRLAQSAPRFERTFCMKTCSENDDCRTDEDYACINAEEVEAWSATVVERGKASKKVCAPLYTGVTVPVERAAEVCQSTSDASFPDPLPPPRPEASTEAGSGPSRGGASDAPPDAPAAEAGPDASVDGSADARAAIDARADGPSADAGRTRDAGRDALAD